MTGEHTAQLAQLCVLMRESAESVHNQMVACLTALLDESVTDFSVDTLIHPLVFSLGI